jgi:hypothetical protein
MKTWTETGSQNTRHTLMDIRRIASQWGQRLQLRGQSFLSLWLLPGKRSDANWGNSGKIPLITGLIIQNLVERRLKHSHFFLASWEVTATMKNRYDSHLTVIRCIVQTTSKNMPTNWKCISFCSCQNNWRAPIFRSLCLRGYEGNLQANVPTTALRWYFRKDGEESGCLIVDQSPGDGKSSRFGETVSIFWRGWERLTQ